MECIYCNFELPNNAKFCPKCTNQIICLDCNEFLYKDSSICISCGKTLRKSNATNSLAVNNIEFTENENGKTFRASFTDTVAGNVVETFAQILPINNYSSSKKSLPNFNNSITDKLEEIQNAEVVESNNISSGNLARPTTPNDSLDLEKIFKNKDGNISIYDTRIKAASRKDFIARITILFLYYKELHGVYEVARTEVNNILQSEKLYDGSFRSWLSQSRTLIDNKQNYLELRPEGKELAVKYLSEFLDSSVPNNWDLKNSGKRNTVSKEDSNEGGTISNGKSKSSKKLLSYQYIQTLNLKPSNKQSLIDFSSEYDAKSNFEHNLIFVYYLEKILNEKNISVNHLYTCYKELGIKVPNIYQSITDTKKHKGWIETKDTNDLKVPIAGENHLEHKMKR